MSNMTICAPNGTLMFDHKEGYGATQYIYFKRLTENNVKKFISIVEKDLAPLKEIDILWLDYRWKLKHPIIKILSYTQYFYNIQYLLTPGIRLEYDYITFTSNSELFTNVYTKAELITPRKLQELRPKTIEEMDAFRKLHADSFKILDEIHVKMGLLQHD